MTDLNMQLRLEGHLYVKNGSGHTINVSCRGNKQPTQTDISTGFDTVVNFTIYDGDDWFPQDSYMVDLRVINKDNNKTYSLDRRFYAPYLSSMVVLDNPLNPGELEFIFVEAFPTMIQSANRNKDKRSEAPTPP